MAEDPAPLAHVAVTGEVHPLTEHLSAVAALAAEFASRFSAEDWARCAGIWHDLGEFRSGFQRYIRQALDPDAHVEGKVGGRDKSHSAAGALWADEFLSRLDGPKGRAAARVLANRGAPIEPGESTGFLSQYRQGGSM
ncbi:MAG: CRISPR-associated endonuclease Cas3'' [Gammaproteobacteria bacterium]|nr:CRISPR-associated endonuclease Cas3'' [Gammaproteobacteria bacterium]